MELFLSLLFWIFGSASPNPHPNQVPLNLNAGNTNYYMSQPAAPSQPRMDLIETRRTSLRSRMQQTIIIFEDTHFRPGRN
ncbi:MAG: hypothetical protein SF052_10090 [Bacteroidia bacterium]|nr:hypothetical protein [Bacteroidia bacterium]